MASASLSYSTDNATWTKVAMSFANDAYRGVLPEAPLNSTLWYQISVADAAGNIAVSPVFRYVVGRPLSYQQLLVSYEELLTRYQELLQKFEELLANYSVVSHEWGEAKSEFEALANVYDIARSQANSAGERISSLEDRYHSLQLPFDELQRELGGLQRKYLEAQSGLSTTRAAYWLVSSGFAAAAGVLVFIVVRRRLG